MKSEGQTEYVLPAACGCHDCSRQVQPGHFACSTVSDLMLRTEAVGLAVRVFDDGVWRWVVTYTDMPRWRRVAAGR